MPLARNRNTHTCSTATIGNVFVHKCRSFKVENARTCWIARSYVFADVLRLICAFWANFNVSYLICLQIFNSHTRTTHAKRKSIAFFNGNATFNYPHTIHKHTIQILHIYYIQYNRTSSSLESESKKQTNQQRKVDGITLQCKYEFIATYSVLLWSGKLLCVPEIIIHIISWSENIEQINQSKFVQICYRPIRNKCAAATEQIVVAAFTFRHSLLHSIVMNKHLARMCLSVHFFFTEPSTMWKKCECRLFFHDCRGNMRTKNHCANCQDEQTYRFQTNTRKWQSYESATIYFTAHIKPLLTQWVYYVCVLVMFNIYV